MQLLQAELELVDYVKFAKSQGETERKQAAYERVRIYSDEFKSVIDDALRIMFSKDSYNTMRSYIDVSQNLAKRIVNEISSVYDSDAVRKAMVGEESVERYQELVDSMQLNLRMDKANHFANLLNDVVLKVTPRGETIGVDILTPSMTTVFQSSDDPNRVDALVYSVPVTDALGNESLHWVVWTPSRHAVYTDALERLIILGNEDNVNPYASLNLSQDKFYPFVFVHRQQPEDSFFDQHSGSDMIEATKQVAIRNTFINMMFVLNFKQIWVNTDSVNIPNNQVKDPFLILQLSGQSASAGIFDYAVDIPGLSEANSQLVFQIANNYGISSENFKLTADTSSGFARKVANSALTRNREKQIKLWRQYEHDMFEAIRAVNNTHFTEQIPDAAEFSIDFAEQEFEDDPVQMVDLWQKKIEAGVASILDWLRYENPDLKGAPDDEVEKVLSKNLQLRAKVRDRFGIAGARSLLNGQTDNNLPGQQGGQAGSNKGADRGFAQQRPA